MSGNRAPLAQTPQGGELVWWLSVYIIIDYSAQFFRVCPFCSWLVISCDNAIFKLNLIPPVSVSVTPVSKSFPTF